MILARSRLWLAELPKGGAAVAITLEREAAAGEPAEFRIDIPLREFRRVLKMLRGDRKLLGGLLLDFARQKDRLSGVIANDRLYLGLVEILGDTTLALLEHELLEIVAPET